jgi:hypothetical protein
VTRYCAHFGEGGDAPAAVSAPAASVAGTAAPAASVATAPAAPVAVTPAAVEIKGGVTGMSAEQTARLRARVAAWVGSSLWNARPGGAVGHGTIDGRLESSFQHQTVTLHARYKQRITLGVIGSSSPKPGSYVSTSGVATGKIDSDFPYDVEESRGHYGMNVNVTLDLGAAQTVVLKLKRVENIKAWDHDVRFDDAGIAPVHESVPTVDFWVSDQLDRMATRAIWVLNRQFLGVFCARDHYAVDEAARCLAAGQRPTGVMTALAGALGESAEPLIEILHPPPPPEKDPPAIPRPARSRRVQTGAVDDEEPSVN